jgi:thiamine pyrophosphokinase
MTFDPHYLIRIIPAEGRFFAKKPSSAGGWFFMPRAIIFANGTLPDPTAARNLLRDDDFIVAADGGLHNALASGVTPHAVIGDFDSVTPTELAGVEKTGAHVIRYPAQKDETDLELAVHFVLENQFRVILVVGALGGRLDQMLGNIALLADVPPGVDIRLDDGCEEVLLVNSHVDITGQRGDTISLIPWGAPADGVSTENLRYPLRGETLYPPKTRGISNEMLGENAKVQLARGTLIVIHSRK